MKELSLAEYLGAEFDSGTEGMSPVMRWDNYLSIYLKLYDGSVSKLFFATQNEGNCPPEGEYVYDVSPWDLIENTAFRFKKRPGPWIINIDLDYFICATSDPTYVRLFSDEYIDAFFDIIATRMKEPDAVLTLCLSPECCGGWAPAERLLHLADRRLRLGLELPQSP